MCFQGRTCLVIVINCKDATENERNDVKFPEGVFGKNMGLETRRNF